MVINLTPLTLAKPAINGGTDRVDLMDDTNITVSVSRILTANTRKAVGTDIHDESTVYIDAEVHYQKLLLDKHELMLSNSGDGDVTVLVIVNTFDNRRWVSVNFRIEPNGKVGE